MLKMTSNLLMVRASPADNPKVRHTNPAGQTDKESIMPERPIESEIPPETPPQSEDGNNREGPLPLSDEQGDSGGELQQRA